MAISLIRTYDDDIFVYIYLYSGIYQELYDWIYTHDRYFVNDHWKYAFLIQVS